MSPVTIFCYIGGFGISMYARQTTANTGHMHKASMYTGYERFMGHKETKGCLAGPVMRHIFHQARFLLNHPRILSLFLHTGVFAVSPVGFGVSAGTREASAPGSPTGRGEETD